MLFRPFSVVGFGWLGKCDHCLNGKRIVVSGPLNKGTASGYYSHACGVVSTRHDIFHPDTWARHHHEGATNLGLYHGIFGCAHVSPHRAQDWLELRRC